MTYTLKCRSVVPPRDPANRQSVEQLKFVVDELSGAAGATYDRAVRVGELVKVGLLRIQPDGALGANTQANARTSTQTSAPQGELAVAGNLTFIGTARRIQGDFTNSSVSNRLLFQTVSSNSPTNVGVIPSGTATTALVTVFNSSTPDNAGGLQLRMESGLAVINSIRTGNGQTRDLSFQFDGFEVARLTSLGDFRAINASFSGVVSIRPFSSALVETTFTFGGTYFRAPIYQNNALGSGFVRHPRIFVQSFDPDWAAGDGDLWVWAGFVRYRSGQTWVTAAT